jgi:hypothetical protein
LGEAIGELNVLTGVRASDRAVPNVIGRRGSFRPGEDSSEGIRGRSLRRLARHGLTLRVEPKLGEDRLIIERFENLSLEVTFHMDHTRKAISEPDLKLETAKGAHINRNEFARVRFAD